MACRIMDYGGLTTDSLTTFAFLLPIYIYAIICTLCKNEFVITHASNHKHLKTNCTFIDSIFSDALNI